MASKEKQVPELRMPPQNVEAEISALGSLMLDKDAVYQVVDALRPQDFYRPAHRQIYEAMLDLFERREPIDILSVSTRLREKSLLEEIGGSAYLTTLVNAVPTASHVQHYATIVRRKRLLRDLIEASGHIAQLGYREEDDVEALIDEAEQKIFGIAKDSLKQEYISVRDALAEAWERIERIHKDHDALRGVTTGFQDLDNILGGLQKSDLIVLAARPSLGKTSLALDIARNAGSAGHPVGVFSIEMSREQIMDRLIAAEAGVDLWRLRTGRLRQEGEDNDFARLQGALGTLSTAPLFLDDSPSPTVMQLRAKARRLQAEHKIELMMIDYLQLIRGQGSVESRVQEVSEISRSLKAMAKELNIPVLAISQLSRGVEMRPSSIPKLSDLRESGCLAGTTLITRADTGERLPISDLVGKSHIPIFSLGEQNKKLEVKYITKVFSSGRKQLFELKTRSGRTIEASANHPFLTINGWQRLDTLQTGAQVAFPRILTPFEPPSPLSDDEIILLAHLTGDGCVLPRQPIHYTSADSENIAAVASIGARLFQIKPRIVRQKNWWHVYLPSPYHLTHGRHHPIVTWFQKLGLRPVRSYEKILPSAIFVCSPEKLRLFLHHLWATDGNISWKYIPGRKPAAAIYYATTSKTLAEQVQHLLLRLGIASTLRMVPQKKQQKIYRNNYQIHIQGSQSQLQFCKLIGSFGRRGSAVPRLLDVLQLITSDLNLDVIPKEAWRTLIDPERRDAGLSWRDLSAKIQPAYCGSALLKNGISRNRMGLLAKAIGSETLRILAQSDICWDKIVSIKALGVEEVFDATVPGTHNFVAGDFIVHNSIEQDADVVMFIYREDKVKEHTDRKNIAEIRIEKHRNGPTGKIELYFHEETASFRPIAKYYEEPL